MKAQSSSDSCPGWKIEVNAQPATNILDQLGGTTTDCSDGGACNNLYYYVSLVRVGSENNTTSMPPTTFSFLTLNFSGSLSVTSAGATARILSHLDAAASKSCSPADVNSSATSPIASWDDDGKFSYLIENTTATNWPVYGRRLLFVIAVDAYPGETVGLGSLFGSFTLATSPPPLVCSSSTVVTSGTTAKTLPALSSCGNSGFRLKIGSAVSASVPGYANAVKFPVYVNGSASSYSVQDLQFLIRITSNQPMTEITLEKGVLEVEDISLYEETSSMNQRVYCSAQNFSVDGGSTATAGNILFYVVIKGPDLASDCMEGDAFFVGIPRVKHTSSSVCCQPIAQPTSAPGVGLPHLFSFGATPCLADCSTAISLSVKKSAAVANDACKDLYFEVDIVNNSGSPLGYTSGQIILNLTHSGTLNNPSYSLAAPPYDVTYNSSLTSVTATNLGSVFRMTFDFTALSLITVPANGKKTLAIFKLNAPNSDVCITDISFYDALLSTSSSICLPLNVSSEIGGLHGSPICLQSYSVSFEKPYTATTTHPIPTGIPEVDYTIVSTGCTIEKTSDDNGLGTGCLCTGDKQTLTPSKDDNPLNGVTTYDLVLISQHILGIQALDSPYKIIAADAKNDQSVTTSDIVELRKLILGIFTVLPNNKSWRFVPKSFVFPNPVNPFQTVFDEVASLSLSLPLPGPSLIEFYGVKIGDVNGNALTSVVSNTSEDRGANNLPLAYKIPVGSQQGEKLEIPLFVQQAADLVAWQLALQYDPAQWQIKGVRWVMSAETTIYQMADWHSPVPGELRLSWFDRTGTATHLAAQAPLAYVQVERRVSGSLSPSNAWQISSTMPNAAYSSSGQASEFALTAVEQYQAPAVVDRAIQAKPEWTVSAYPNPTSGTFRFEVSLPAGGAGRVGVYDPMGQLVSEYDCILVPGLNVITSQSFPALHTGLYFVRFDTPLGRQTLRLVKN